MTKSGAHAMSPSLRQSLRSLCTVVADGWDIELSGDAGLNIFETPGVVSWTAGTKLPPAIRETLCAWAENPDDIAEVRRLASGLFFFGAIHRATGRVVLVIDPVNMYRVYRYSASGRLLLTSHPTNVDISSLTVSEAALASYFANGSMIGDLSPFNELRLLQPASVHSFCAGKHESVTTYWTPHFPRNSQYDRAKTKRRLKEAIVESVRRCCDSKRVIVSLSGGYDSSAILGVLSSVLRIKDVLCVSYVQGSPAGHSDAAVAAQQAGACGYRHLVRQSHHSDFLRTVLRNAELGEGVAYFCQELDAWCELFQELQSPNESVLLAGDECFGWVDRELASDQDVLRSISVAGFAAVGALRPFMGGAMFDRWSQHLASQIAGLLRSTPDGADLHDQKDELYLRHRIPHVLLPWRRFIIGSSLPVHVPFLDREILDLMTEVPVEDRRGKRLYREAVTEAFPEIFKIPRAYYEQAVVQDWIPSMERQESAIEDWIKGTPSLLDSIIEPERQLAMVRGLLQRASGASAISSATRFKELVRNALFSMGLRSMVEGLRGRSRLQWDTTVPNSQLIIRLLIMRGFLST